MSLKNFEIGKRLGKGSFGSVCIVTRKKDNIKYAMKRVVLSNSPKSEIEAALNEIRLLASLKHPNIIGYKETFYDEESGTLNIVMELAEGGDLSKKIEINKKKKLLFDENLIWEWIFQILSGVLYLHDHQIIHRDLKCANIFLTKNGVLKIGDLNVSKLSKNNYARTKTGTPYYLAPEVWEDRPYDYKCDIWSFGCIIYELCCLVPPFRGTNFKELFRNIKNGNYNQISDHYSEDLKKIIRDMLVTNPNKRLSARELFNSSIIQNRMKNNMRKDIIEKIRKANNNYNLICTIKMPINLKDINKILPHENYQMEGNDPYETMKKTIKLMGNNETNKNNNNNNNNIKIQPLNNYNRELANQKKQNQLNNNKNINNNLIDNINNNNIINKQNPIPNNMKPIIVGNEQNKNYNNNFVRREYAVFNNNNNLNNNNNNNNILNYNNNKQNNEKTPIKDTKNNSKNNSNKKPNQQKQNNNVNTNTRKRLEKEKFDKIKNEFNIKPEFNRRNNQKPPKQNEARQRRPPSGNPKNIVYNNNIFSNKNNNYNNNNHNKNIINNNINYNNNNINNMNHINNKNLNYNNNNKNAVQRRPYSHHNNRLEYNNIPNNNYPVKNNNYLRDNNHNKNNNYLMKNNNNHQIKKYEIKNHHYNYNGEDFDMKPYKKQVKANYDKLDVNKYKVNNNKKFNAYLYNGGKNYNNNNYNYNNKQINPNRQRVNPANKYNNNQRNGKYY